VDTYNPVPGYIEGVPSSRNYDGGFMVKLIKKDLKLAIDAATEGGATCAETQRAWEMYSKLDEMGYSDKDFSFVYQYFKSGFNLPDKE